MSMNTENNDKARLNEQYDHTENGSDTDKNSKPHIIRRNIEDYLAERALKKRLTDIFDDDFLLD